MEASPILRNRSGQGTVENLMLTAILAAVLLPIVYETVLVPLLNVYKENRGQLVTFVSQKKKTTVPSGWFASERMAQLKEPKKIDETQEIKTDSIPEPGEVAEPKTISEPKEIQTKPINEPKTIQEPKTINPPSSGKGGGSGSGAGGSGSAMGPGSQDPNFFSGDKADGGAKSEGQIAAGDAGRGSGSSSGGDEYSPQGKVQAGGLRGDEKGQGPDGKKDDSSVEKRSKQNLALNETREAERSRSSPFDWWLLIKILIIGLIIFLLILIGLSNLKRR